MSQMDRVGRHGMYGIGSHDVCTGIVVPASIGIMNLVCGIHGQVGLCKYGSR